MVKGPDVMRESSSSFRFRVVENERLDAGEPRDRPLRRRQAQHAPSSSSWFHNETDHHHRRHHWTTRITTIVAGANGVDNPYNGSTVVFRQERVRQSPRRHYRSSSFSSVRWISRTVLMGVLWETLSLPLQPGNGSRGVVSAAEVERIIPTLVPNNKSSNYNNTGSSTTTTSTTRTPSSGSNTAMRSSGVLDNKPHSTRRTKGSGGGSSSSPRTNVMPTSGRTSAEQPEVRFSSASSATQSSSSSSTTTTTTTRRAPKTLDTRKSRNVSSSSSSSLDTSKSVPASKPTVATTPRRPTADDRRESEVFFLSWCKQVLGITTELEIRHFDYYDYMKAMPSEDWQDDAHAEVVSVEAFPMRSVRGLAAPRAIAAGETVIRIPLRALLSVPTTIDQDPILASVMGPEARRKHGWIFAAADDDAAEEEDLLLLRDPIFWEMALLSVALLHHVRLGSSSPLAPYVTMLHMQETDRYPFLWSDRKLKETVSEGIRTVARGIRREMEEMYESVVPVLAKTHPHLFGETEDWMFSLERFQWAFAMVNTRHWQVPIVDLQYNNIPPPSAAANFFGSNNNNRDERDADDEDPNLQPPASTPTDAWVMERRHLSDEDAAYFNEGEQGEQDPPQPQLSISHPFLAPVADLLNFGPPCTRGWYDERTHTFEIIATCDIPEGHEVTFWYGGECDHVMVAAYGFMHPDVPACPSAEEYRARSEEWQQKAAELQLQLEDAYRALGELTGEVEHLRDVLSDCDCCVYDERRAHDDTFYRSNTEENTPREHVRGAASSQPPLQEPPPQRHARDIDAPSTADPQHGGGTRTRRRWQGRRSQQRQPAEF